MAKLNKAAKSEPIHTHEGAVAHRINPYLQLRRSVCSCMLWEDEFYEDGLTIANRIAELCSVVAPNKVAELAIEAREKFKLRHVPLVLVRQLAREGYKETAKTLERVIQRPDELTEFLAIYWNGEEKQMKKSPLSAQVKKGLAKAFQKFNEYQLAKYNRATDIKLRDVLFLSHARPLDEKQEAVWKRLVDNTLVTPDTWEVSLSGGKDKRETFERLITEKKLGALAMLRNLRNMEQAGVPMSVVEKGLTEMKTDRVLPFRFIAAAKYVPRWENMIEKPMLKCTESMPRLRGKTALLVDHSGSMQETLSAKSEITRFDAAAAVGMILREICTDEFRVFTFSTDCIEVPPRRGFALREAIMSRINPAWTKLGAAVRHVYREFPDCERLIVITDEQSADQPKDPQGKGYVINVASARNGVGYGAWKHIDGFSEAVVGWIHEYERLEEESHER